MNEDLFKAILAMDSYYRGYEAGIDLRQKDVNGNPIDNSDVFKAKIGTAQIVTVLDENGQEVALDSGRLLENGSRKDIGVGFYALTYQLDTNGDGAGDGEYLIAYRGTDYPQDDTFPAKDITHGWLMGGGFTTLAQADLAIDFYNEVVDELYGIVKAPNDDSVKVSLTGHSLGGGLSGFIGALYDQDAVVFDSMTYELAAQNSYERATERFVVWTDSFGFEHQDDLNEAEYNNLVNNPNVTITHASFTDLAYRLSIGVDDMIFGGNTWNVDLNGIKGYHVQSEILDLVLPARSLPGNTASSEPEFYLGEDGVFYDLAQDQPFYQAIYTGVSTWLAGVSGAAFSTSGLTVDDFLEGIALHSQASLVIRMFANEPDQTSNTDWQKAAQYFWPILYDSGFAGNVGMIHPSLAGELQTASGYDGILRGIIAYSAIEHEVAADGTVISQSVFGDTGIRAFYDDANNLGRAITDAGASSVIETYATDISKAFVQFAANDNEKLKRIAA